MDFRRPLKVVTPTLDGDVLRVLAATTKGLTGREVVRLLGLKSHEGVRRVLERLVEQGIVLREPVGRALHYRLNREHLAAPWIENLATLRRQLIERLSEQISDWAITPVVAVLFGSAVRGEAHPDSDLDILIVRPSGCDPDDARWRDQLTELESAATAWTGNDTRILEYGEEEVATLRTEERVLESAAREGLELYGDIGVLHRARKGARAP